MEFEFDPEKSESNREKHGIDFYAAQSLWDDDSHLIVPARSTTEARYALIAKYHGSIWTCIFTLRGKNLRIISVRKARYEENDRYHNI